MTGDLMGRQVGGDHYRNLPIQVTEFCYKNGIPFMEGAIIKYVVRWRNKGGIEDLKKAEHFIQILIDLAQKDYDEGIQP